MAWKNLVGYRKKSKKFIDDSNNGSDSLKKKGFLRRMTWSSAPASPISSIESPSYERKPSSRGLPFRSPVKGSINSARSRQSSLGPPTMKASVIEDEIDDDFDNGFCTPPTEEDAGTNLLRKTVADLQRRNKELEKENLRLLEELRKIRQTHQHDKGKDINISSTGELPISPKSDHLHSEATDPSNQLHRNSLPPKSADRTREGNGVAAVETPTSLGSDRLSEDDVLVDISLNDKPVVEDSTGTEVGPLVTPDDLEVNSKEGSIEADPAMKLKNVRTLDGTTTSDPETTPVSANGERAGTADATPDSADTGPSRDELRVVFHETDISGQNLRFLVSLGSGAGSELEMAMDSPVAAGKEATAAAAALADVSTMAVVGDTSVDTDNLDYSLDGRRPGLDSPCTPIRVEQLSNEDIGGNIDFNDSASEGSEGWGGHGSKDGLAGNGYAGLTGSGEVDDAEFDDENGIVGYDRKLDRRSPRPDLYDTAEWMLNTEMFEVVDLLWGSHTVDLFASLHNAQLPRFYSLAPQPGCIGVDAFEYSWEGENAWAHPPPTQIYATLQKVRSDRVSLTICVPAWPTMPWWPVLLSMLVDHPLVIPNQGNTFSLARDGAIAPAAAASISGALPDYTLVVCRVCGVARRSALYLRGLRERKPQPSNSLSAALGARSGICPIVETFIPMHPLSPASQP